MEEIGEEGIYTHLCTIAEQNYLFMIKRVSFVYPNIHWL
jgi:hypothetical protein